MKKKKHLEIKAILTKVLLIFKGSNVFVQLTENKSSEHIYRMSSSNPAVVVGVCESTCLCVCACVVCVITASEIYTQEIAIEGQHRFTNHTRARGCVSKKYSLNKFIF